MLKPGVGLPDLMRGAFAAGISVISEEVAGSYIEQRLAQRLSQVPTTREQQYANDRWVRLSERWTPAGGRVGLHTDVTEHRKARAAAETAADWL